MVRNYNSTENRRNKKLTQFTFFIILIAILCYRDLSSMNLEVDGNIGILVPAEHLQDYYQTSSWGELSVKLLNIYKNTPFFGNFTVGYNYMKSKSNLPYNLEFEYKHSIFSIGIGYREKIEDIYTIIYSGAINIGYTFGKLHFLEGDEYEIEKFNSEGANELLYYPIIEISLEAETPILNKKLFLGLKAKEYAEFHQKIIAYGTIFLIKIAYIVNL